MMLRNPRRLALAILPMVAIAGCSLIPDYTRPDAPIPVNYPPPPQYPDQSNGVSTPAVGASGTSDARRGLSSLASSADLGWRDFFQDPRLDRLIEIALSNNRDMRIAVQRVQEARALYGIQQSDLLPTIGAGVNGQIQRNPASVRMGGESADSVSRYVQAGVGMTAFELDFFGRLRSLTKAAYQQFLASEQSQRTVHINLVAQVAEAYFRIRTAEQQRDLVEKTLTAREGTYSLMQSRFKAGVASALDLSQAKTQLDTVRVDLASVIRVEAQARNALQLLVGQALPADLPKGATFGKDQLPGSIPVGLPSDLLVRRPDILGAENNLRSANANIGAARAAFFPNISITGLLGFASNQLGGLFTSGNRFWSFSPQIQTPIFAGGVSGGLDLAKVRKNIAIAQYERTIQVAFREVADALAGEATYSHELDGLRSLERSATETLRLAQLRYDSGIDSFLQVQTAQVALYSAQRTFLQTGMDSLLNRVELYKALGGGWLENSAGAPSSPS